MTVTKKIKREDFQGSKFPDLTMLYPEEFELLYAAAEIQNYAANEAVIVEGQDGDFLYLVKSGLLRVFKEHDNNIYEVASIGPGDVFGEASVLFESKAGAEVRTLDQSEIYVVPSEQVRDILKNNERFMRATKQLAEKRSSASALAVNPVFSTLPLAVREVILFNAKFVNISENEVLVAEGESRDKFMFIILSGEFKVTIIHPTKEHKTIDLLSLRSGDEVGEIAVVTDSPHMATVRAKCKSKVMAIKKTSVVSWEKRYSDFAYALYAAVFRKLEFTEKVLLNHLSPDEARVLTTKLMPTLEAFKKQNGL